MFSDFDLAMCIKATDLNGYSSWIVDGHLLAWTSGIWKVRTAFNFELNVHNVGVDVFIEWRNGEVSWMSRLFT